MTQKQTPVDYIPWRMDCAWGVYHCVQ